MGVVAANTLVNIIGGGLIIVGIVVLWATVAFWRGTHQDHSVLAPLEVMGERKFARADEGERLDLLNDVRPEGAPRVQVIAEPEVLSHEPADARERPFRDTFDHSDDAVDVIDPLLSQGPWEK